MLLLLPQRYVFSSKSQPIPPNVSLPPVVVATTKVRIFKQITTNLCYCTLLVLLLLLPQRYVFSSKSQPLQRRAFTLTCCCCYHKGTYFQANHNTPKPKTAAPPVVVATTKVRIFKQITTFLADDGDKRMLLLLPQRYVFSSKSQQKGQAVPFVFSCCCYHKGTYFQANHNRRTQNK